MTFSGGSRVMPPAYPRNASIFTKRTNTIRIMTTRAIT